MTDREYWKAALIRAAHTFWQTLAGGLPVGIVVTPKMIKELNWSVLYVVLAWVTTALIAAVFSFIKSMAAGMPEVDAVQALEQLADLRERPTLDEEDEEDGDVD